MSTRIKYIAIFIGISRYPNDRDSDKSPSYMYQALNDINALSQLVCNSYDKVYLLTNEKIPTNKLRNTENITIDDKKRILEQIRSIMSSISESEKKSTLVWVHFSGHGLQVSGDGVQGIDRWELIVPGHSLTVGNLYNAIHDEGIEAGFLTIDACRNEFSTRSVLGSPDLIYGERYKGIYIIGACAPGQFTTNGKDHGIFTERIKKYITELDKTNEPISIENIVKRFDKKDFTLFIYFSGLSEFEKLEIIRKTSNNILIGSEDERDVLLKSGIFVPDSNFLNVQECEDLPNDKRVDGIVNRRSKMYIFISCEVEIMSLNFVVKNRLVPIDNIIKFIVGCFNTKADSISIIFNCAYTQKNIDNLVEKLKGKSPDQLMEQKNIEIYFWENASYAITKKPSDHLFSRFKRKDKDDDDLEINLDAVVRLLVKR